MHFWCIFYNLFIKCTTILAINKRHSAHCRQCISSINKNKTKIDKTFHSSNSEHVNHASNNNQQIFERHILRENCKRKAEENTSTRPLKVIRTELLNSDLPNIMK